MLPVQPTSTLFPYTTLFRSVCVASSLLMLVTVYQNQWMTIVPLDAIRTDPTRMAQGIMTGIGFLGAGVIFKERSEERRVGKECRSQRGGHQCSKREKSIVTQ